MAGNASGTHNGWRYDAANSRLDVYFRGTRVGHFDASGLTNLLGLTSTSASAGIGYATGAGGAVTQITSKATGVTMVPNPCLSGTITTHNASLAAEGTVDFIVTNSAVAVGDTVVLSIQSGTNDGGTIASVAVVGAGVFTVRLYNGNVASGTAETGAILINFAIIKAVSA